MESKNILQSKTFWVNLATLALTVGGYLPSTYAAPVLAIANIILRYFSTQPVTVLPKV